MADWLARARVLVAAPAVVDALTSRRWLVTRAGVDLEVIFSPAVAQEDVAALYPGATLRAVHEPERRAATAAETAELRALIARVLAGDAEADRAEALTIALGDPEAALVSFRALAADLPRA